MGTKRQKQRKRGWAETHKKKKAFRKPGLSHVFDDEAKKKEMVSLRRKGISYLDLAHMYKVDHTTIMYHCVSSLHKNLQRRRYGLKAEIIKMLKQEKTLLAIGREYGVTKLEVEKCCEIFGIPWYSKEDRRKAKEELRNEIFKKLEKKEAPKPALPVYIKTLPPERPGWEKDSEGFWYNRGQSVKEREEEIKRRKRREQEEARKDLLSF